jgi:hypothetical protein
MAATLTKIGGPFIRPGDPYGVGYKFSVLLDTSFASGGEPIDLTSYLGYLAEGTVGGVDAVADAAYLYHIVGPGRAVALTSTNVLIEVLQSPSKTGATEAAEAFAEATAVDLHTVGALVITVWGKAAIQTSWS